MTPFMCPGIFQVLHQKGESPIKMIADSKYRKISNIRRTKSPTSNVSRLVLQLSSPNSMEPGVKSRMKM